MAWECVIVGAGPAGLSAAVYMGRFRRRTLVVDQGDGRWSYGQRNENYLGFPRGISARRLHALGLEQAERFGVEFSDAEVTHVSLVGGRWRLATTSGTVTARTVIWAAGVRDLWPEFPRARRLIGRQLFWCIVCDGWRTRGKKVVLLGNDERCASTALQFLTYTDRLTLVMSPGERRIPRRVCTRLEAEGIRVVASRVRRVHLSEEKLSSVELDHGRTVPADFLFSLFGSTPRTELLRGLPIVLARNGHVRIDDKNRTSQPTFFAAGDVSDKHSHQVVSAAHEGSMAAQAANHVLYPPRQKL